MDVYVCVGSSCHIKNTKGVIDKINARIKAEGLEDKVELKGAFCMGECSQQGVSVRINDVIYSVMEEEADKFFDEHILNA